MFWRHPQIVITIITNMNLLKTDRGNDNIAEYLLLTILGILLIQYY